MYPLRFKQQSPQQLVRTFGQEFSEQLFNLEAGRWLGPLRSSYGLHLVNIEQREDAQIPELATVIDKVRMDWRYQQREKTNRQIYQKLKDGYQIIVEPLPDSGGTAIIDTADRQTS